MDPLPLTPLSSTLPDNMDSLIRRLKDLTASFNIIYTRLQKAENLIMQ